MAWAYVSWGVAHPHVHTYEALASALLATGIVSDPWLDGRPRFGVDPIVLPAADAARYAHAAEAVAAVYDEAARLIVADPWLLEEFFPALTPFQHLMWSASGGAWHGIARADVFATNDPAHPLQICELNVDTPSGEAEAVLLNAAVAPLVPGTWDPNAALERAFVNAVGAFAARVEREEAEAPPTVGILYPTELVEDLSMILLYRRWLEARGCRVVTGSPFNLARAPGGRVALFGTPCDVLVRHYKTDWWSEREPPRDDDEPFADAEPLAAQLGLVLDAELSRRVAVMNPFGAVLSCRTSAPWRSSGKRSIASRRRRRRRFARTSRTRRGSSRCQRRLVAARADWVLKSDYGCEGAEVVIGADVDDAAWARGAAPLSPRPLDRAALLRGPSRSRRPLYQRRRLRRRRRGVGLLQPRSPRRHRLPRHDGGDAHRTRGVPWVNATSARAGGANLSASRAGPRVRLSARWACSARSRSPAARRRGASSPSKRRTSPTRATTSPSTSTRCSCSATKAGTSGNRARRSLFPARPISTRPARRIGARR